MPSNDTAGSGESTPGTVVDEELLTGEVLLLLPLTREWDFQSDPVHTPLRRVAGNGLMVMG